MDRDIIEKAGLEFYGIPSGKLRRYFSLRNVSDVFKVCAGFFAARRILKRQKPVLLFSKGGFVSVPPCAAAASLRIPVFTHDSDYSPGLATRINSRFAEKIFLPYRESSAFFPEKAKGKLIVSGNPIRPEFSGADPAKGRAFLGLKDDERILLVLGGSLGSRDINNLVRASLSGLTRYYTVIHQTGEADADSQTTAERYRAYASFGDEIPHIIAAAELVLCRSGANTIWECKSLGKPMVLVPLPVSASRGDQVENARLFQDAGAAVCFMADSSRDVNESGDPDKLCSLIASLAEEDGRRRAMGDAKISVSPEAEGSGDLSESGAAALIAGEIVRRITGKAD